MYYQDQRSGGLLLPFLAGVLVGPLFFNGINNQVPYQPYPVQYPQPYPYYGPTGPVFYQNIR